MSFFVASVFLVLTGLSMCILLAFSAMYQRCRCTKLCLLFSCSGFLLMFCLASSRCAELHFHCMEQNKMIPVKTKFRTSMDWHLH